MEQIGHVDVVRRYIPAQTLVHVSVIPDAEPEVKVIMQGVEALNFYKADQIIALGGGSVIDAAKIMKLKYESPEADLEELAAPFLDLRKRVVEYPTTKVTRARLIAISTTSGTGSEVTPFAVLTDKQRGRKVTLAESGCGHRRSAVRYVHAERPYCRYRHRLLDPCPGSWSFDLRFPLHRLQRHASHSDGVQVPAHRV
jgi:alcohol dehydrogenase class IV